MTAVLTKDRNEVGPPRPLRAVVLDDDRFDRKRLARWAKSPSSGELQLAEAADLDQFSELVHRDRFDVVFLDFYLADGDGVDALECLLASSRNASAYVVMISGQENPAARRAALERGCDEYVPKSALDAAQFDRILQDASRGAAAEKTLDPRVSAVDYWATRALRRKLPHVSKPNTAAVSSSQGVRRVDALPGYEGDEPFLDTFVELDEFIFNFTGGS